MTLTARSVALLVISGLLTTAAADTGTPSQWIGKMNQALVETDYRGIALREKRKGSGWQSDAMTLSRALRDGVIYEKLVMQEGSGMEILRRGNEVQCILPDKGVVLMETWNGQSTLMSPLPIDLADDDSAYEVRLGESERVAGRTAIMVDIRSRDGYRLGRTLWLDSETGFPLKTQLIGDDGTPVAQIRFLSVDLNPDISAEEFVASRSLDGYRWIEARTVEPAEPPVEWRNSSLPSGFALQSSQVETMSRKRRNVTHLVYSDGLAKVSVFIEAAGERRGTSRSRLGTSNSYTTVLGEHQVTAVGDVPSETVEQIARSMEQ